MKNNWRLIVIYNFSSCINGKSFKRPCSLFPAFICFTLTEQAEGFVLGRDRVQITENVLQLLNFIKHLPRAKSLFNLYRSSRSWNIHIYSFIKTSKQSTHPNAKIRYRKKLKITQTKQTQNTLILPILAPFTLHH